jgi:hypothetical protein
VGPPISLVVTGQAVDEGVMVVFSCTANHRNKGFKGQSRSFVKCIFLQFTHSISYENAELRSSSRGNGIARRGLFESGEQKIEAIATPLRLCLIRITHCAIYGRRLRRVVSPGSMGLRASEVDHARLLMEASYKLLCPATPRFQPIRPLKE